MRPKKDASAPQSYFCLGIIKYADADGGASKNGILLYVKPGLRGDEPPDIASYAMDLEGAAGALTGADEETARGQFQQMLLSSPSMRIAGGTDEILRNIIAERVLGLPGDIRVDKDVPFNKIPTKGR